MFEALSENISKVLKYGPNSYQRKKCSQLIVKICTMEPLLLKHFIDKIAPLFIEFIDELPQNACLSILTELVKMREEIKEHPTLHKLNVSANSNKEN